MNALLRIAVMLSVTILSACSGGATQNLCNVETCAGCCDGTTCLPGLAATACGQKGNACNNCLGGGQVCGIEGQCVSVNGGGGGGAAGGGGGGAVGGAGGAAGSGGGGPSCNSSLSACAGMCVDTKTDPQHCGGCMAPCSGGAACNNGRCSTAPADCTLNPCPAQGFYCDLGTKQCKAGCVLDSQCGGALNTCDTATRTCGCQMGSCGTDRYCTAARTCAAGCEQDQCRGALPQCNLSTRACVCSETSCPAGSFCGRDGACKTGCNSNTQCNSGSEICNQASNVCECNTGFHRCGTTCSSNAAITSCGNSCTPCAAPPPHATATCTQGTCGFTCDSYYFRVGHSCYPMQSSAKTTHLGSESWCSLYDDGVPSCSSDISFTPPIRLAWLVADYDTMCGVSMAGQTHCVGKSNGTAALGLGATAMTNVFTPLANIPSNVIKVEHTASRGVALTATGELWRWGDGWQASGYLSPVTTTRTPVRWSPSIKDVGLGEEHLCLIGTTQPDRMSCYGGFSDPVRGTYATVSWPAPSGVVLEKLAMASNHGCAIDSQGRVLCWGQAGSWGRLGYTTPLTQDRPLTVVANFPPAGRKAIAIAVTSNDNSCAVLDNGDLYCWGRMGSQTTAQPVPQKMANFSGLVNVHGTTQLICPTPGSSCFDP